MPPVRITIKMIDQMMDQLNHVKPKQILSLLKVVQLFKEAGQAVSSVPFLLLQPLGVRARAGLITHIITRKHVCTNLVIPYWHHKCTTMIILHNHPNC